MENDEKCLSLNAGGATALVWEPVITQSARTGRERGGGEIGRGGEESSGPQILPGPGGPRRMREERASEQQKILAGARAEERGEVEEVGGRPNLAYGREP